MEEKTFFKSPDGLRLCGILSIPRVKTNKCIVLCHGLTVDKEEGGIFTDLAKELVKAGFNVFRFDFRGRGESEGNSVDMTVMGEVKDLEGAIKLLQEKGYRAFGILGASFAGGVVSLFVSKHATLIRALVLWNALIDYGSLMNPVTDWEKRYWGRGSFDRVEKFGFTEIGSGRFKVGKELISEIKVLEPWSELLKTDIPILFVHGDQDTFVPIEDSIKYASKMQNSELKIISGAEHEFHDDPKHAEEANKAAVEFFLKNM